MPVRVQLRRTKGWRMPENTVKVTRPGKWGNPFVVHPGLLAGQEMKGVAWGCFAVPTLEDAIACFRESLLIGDDAGHRLADDLHELRGKNLACFCRLDDPCHADVLLELANTPTAAEGSRDA